MIEDRDKGSEGKGDLGAEAEVQDCRSGREGVESLVSGPMISNYVYWDRRSRDRIRSRCEDGEDVQVITEGVFRGLELKRAQPRSKALHVNINPRNRNIRRYEGGGSEVSQIQPGRALLAVPEGPRPPSAATAPGRPGGKVVACRCWLAF